MPSTIATAPLVPRGASKATKKKRPGFRPVGKSSKINSNKLPSKPKPEPEPDSLNDLSSQELPLKAQDVKPAENVTDEESQDEHSTDQTNPVEQQASEAITQPFPKVQSKSTTKKRKQSTTISIGFRKKLSASANNLDSIAATVRTTTTTVTTKKLGQLDTANESSISSPKSIPIVGEKVSDDAESRASTTYASNLHSAGLRTIVVPQDRDLLQRLQAENPEGVRLKTFCSTFKVDKDHRRRREEQAGNVPITRPKQNNNEGNTTNNQNNFTGRNAPENSGTPVVTIVDGEIVLQESSLMVPGQRRTVEEVEEEYQDVVEEDTHLAIVGASYTSFVDRKGPHRWTLEDTKRFFEALRQMGTDFCSMEHFFENRTRKQLKRKYQAELVRNPTLVEMALDPKKKAKVDMSIFDVEVDPKAIEAAAKDEPPPYIPTDPELQEKVSELNDENKTETRHGAIGKLEQWKEIIEEDAEEEARLARRAGKSTNAIKKVTIDEASLWPSVYEDDAHNQPLREEDIHFAEPSMDDFFHEHEEIDGSMEQDGNGPEKDSIPVNTPASPKVSARASSITLVPTKASGKSNKPKFRTKSRKKK